MHLSHISMQYPLLVIKVIFSYLQMLVNTQMLFFIISADGRCYIVSLLVFWISKILREKRMLNLW